MDWLALDIGGANLKMADGRGFADSRPFALWRESHRLAQELRRLMAEAPASDHLAVTMTGELADCFETKELGVRFILEAVGEASDGRHTRVYLCDGRMVTPQVALKDPLLAAAANWRALAEFAGRFAKRGGALLIDVGSTTCDIVPLIDGKPATHNTTDLDRMLSGELVYTGVERSPVCALVDRVPYRERECPLAQEVFATTRDVYLVLGELAEHPADNHTADHRPATREHAVRRLARMLSAPADRFTADDAVAMAKVVAKAQAARIAAGVRQVVARMPVQPEVCLLSGHGAMAAQRAIDQDAALPAALSLGEKLGADVNRCLTAHALAVLSREASGP